MLKLISFLLVLHLVYSKQPPNVCKHFIDYFTMSSENCWHNPDVYETAPEILKRRGYEFETYEVETEDNYLLTMYRLPRINSKKIVYLQHPATATCVGWIDKDEKSPAFIFWKAGYDVWLGNSRGSYYSRKHKFLDPNEKPYWNFSFHEMGIYDIKNQIDKIVNLTNAEPQSITYVGYSMSSTSALIYASLLPEHSEKWLNLMVLMAPSAFMKNMHQFVGNFVPNVEILKKTIEDLDMGEVVPHSPLFTGLQIVCRTAPTMFLCLASDMYSFGNVPDDFVAEWYPIMHYQVPGGLSMKCYLHYLQLVTNNNKFQNYDYGPEENLNHYNSTTPPRYPLEDISTPIYLMYAEYDPLITPKDSEHLYEMLPAKAKIYGKKKFRNFGHASFFYGRYLVEKVYIPLVKLIDGIHENRI